ncbi:MAG: SLATT domain-containing protein [Candidatus Binatia bacterium]
MATKTSRYLPPQSQEQLVLAWLRRERESQMAHYEMADVLSKRGRLLGGPVILLTSLVGASALGSVASEVIPNWSKILIGLLSIAAAILSSLQTFFGYADRAEKHRVSAARFGSIRRQFESIYAKRDEGIDGQVMETLRQDLDALAQEALHVPAKIFYRVQESPLYVDGEDSNQRTEQAG